MYSSLLQETQRYNATLVAVSKTKPNEQILALYEKGQRIFGENRVQELVEKANVLPNDILWHQIGHLQTNKVKYIAPFVSCIHAVDSHKLLEEINKQAIKNNRTIDCLLQFKIAQEDSKFGLSQVDGFQLAREAKQFSNVRICGVMGMASFVDNPQQVKKEFGVLKTYFDQLKDSIFKDTPHFKDISMGMSGDYKIALEAGSTMVRIGSLLFGAR